jgi:hypothetical protein
LVISQKDNQKINIIIRCVLSILKKGQTRTK